MNLNALRIQYRMAANHGYRRKMLTEAVLGSVARFLDCRVRGNHREKMASHGRCYRCGKAMR